MMSVELTWGVAQMDCFTEKNGIKDVVCCIHWTLVGKDGDFVARNAGAQVIPTETPMVCCSSDGMTLEQAIEILKSAMGPEQVAFNESVVIKMVADLINPTIINPPLPWETTNEQ